METEEDLRSPLKPGRAGRAVALMVLSLLVIGLVTLTYVHPQLSSGGSKQPSPTLPAAPFAQVSTLDFVDPSTGWVVGEVPSNDFAVLHTTDAGRTWARQLTGPGGDVGEYAHFFDKLNGVVVVLGLQAVKFRTRDGGKTWLRQDLAQGGGHVISADYVDPGHGWLLVQSPPDPRGETSEALFITSDGGTSWVDLGNPVSSGDWAFRVAFADHDHGWLYTRSSAAYAYASDDGGSTWRRIMLPAPNGSWPLAPPNATAPEEFFVAASPTRGSGVVADVVPIAPPQGRWSTGGILLDYPPLTVRGFDGGQSIVYHYRTFVDASPYRSLLTDFSASSGLGSSVAYAEEVGLRSADGGASWSPISPPPTGGSVGFAGPLDWWWVGAGSLASTSDGGITWTAPETIGVPEPLPGTLQVLDRRHAWFAAMVGAKPVLETTADGGRRWAAVSLPAPVAG
ncbi:MAG TPA: hypothetical protein VLR46_10485 [Candidatus Dormibacteraeota bacterium]|nr:hypothetical protein [Candidatus Dormibacteraeota bacterium]